MNAIKHVCGSVTSFNTPLTNVCVVYLHSCVFLLIWAYIQVCRSRGTLLLSGLYSCVHRCWHCMSAHWFGLRKVDLMKTCSECKAGHSQMLTAC